MLTYCRLSTLTLADITGGLLMIVLAIGGGCRRPEPAQTLLLNADSPFIVEILFDRELRLRTDAQHVLHITEMKIDGRSLKPKNFAGDLENDSASVLVPKYKTIQIGLLVHEGESGRSVLCVDTNGVALKYGLPNSFEKMSIVFSVQGFPVEFETDFMIDKTRSHNIAQARPRARIADSAK